MAMVLDAFASYLVDMLTQAAADEVRTMLGVSGDIQKMGDKLRDLKNLLADADRRNITDEAVREWVGLLKRAMYEATDILDLCQLKAMERGSSSSSIEAGCFNPLLFCMRNPFHAREIGTRIKKLNQRLDSIKERSTAFSFINLEDHRSNAHASANVNPSRESIGDFVPSAVVGEKIEEDTRTLVAQIMQTGKEVNDDIMVVAIVGVSGIGKTTLAQKIFNDEVIQREFSKKIWLSVNQNFNEVELLRRAIIEAGEDHRAVGDAEVALHRTLKDALIGHKTLLVMDDVWDHEAWEGVLKIPLAKATTAGSRVLITTRDEDVARGMRATWPYHHVSKLLPEDAWSLLKKQVISSEKDEDHINTLRDIGLEIIEKCGGLPLAVKVMGGLLRKRGVLRCDWEQVLDDSKWSMPQELNHAVYLSYEYMPSYLKQCFLYYSLLPKNRNFNINQVIAMWISEGFIHGNSSDLEELGKRYFNELVSRNLIEPDRSYPDIWICKMHDVVRSFAHYMIKDEAFLAEDGDIDILSNISSQNFLRLSMETNRSQSVELDWKSLQTQQSVRTLISTAKIKMKLGDSLINFSSLRTLYIQSTDVVVLVESLHKLKHLRYLALLNTDVSVLPGNIGKMKLLQFLDLSACTKLVNLPDNIVMLGQLRLLNIPKACMVPRGFSGLTDLRVLNGFRVHMDGDWCSLDELGLLSQLRTLDLNQLENISAPSFAANARLGKKNHLAILFLHCTSRLGDKGVSEEEHQLIESVFNELCPPPSIENLEINGYFGRQLPSWMMFTSMVPFSNLKTLLFSDMAYCTQLPNGLCQLPYLQALQVHRAPCIRHIGIRFLQTTKDSFPRLNRLCLKGMAQLEEWDWEEQVQAMPCLEEFLLEYCRLRRVPPGLASSARALKKLSIQYVQHLSYIENFPFVVELIVHDIPKLQRIINFPNLQKLTIFNCPKLKVVESIPALKRLNLEDYAMDKLPEYMRLINPRHLQLFCRIWLLCSVAEGQSGLDWDKFSHVENVRAYAHDGDNQRKWYVVYTRRDNFKLYSNINNFVFEETLSSCMVDAQGFESVYKMRRSTFSYVYSLVRIPFFEAMMARDHTFVDGSVLSLQDGVAVALRMLNSGEAPVIVGSSVGVNVSTVSLVTQVFVEAMWKRACYNSLHIGWPGSAKMGMIKHKFDKIHGLPNCCGVVDRAHFTFGSQSCNHEENDGELMQAIVDPDMRFTNIWLGLSDSMNQSSLFYDSRLFKYCEEGTWLNGSKVNLSNGWQVGEYIIGDAGYPLRPWLLTPYQLEDKEDCTPYQAEFNRRHSSASTLAVAALMRLKDTWKFLDRAMWGSVSSCSPLQIIYTCCMLHNIVIDMEEEESNHSMDVRLLADEDACRMRDILSHHLIESGVDTMAAEEEQEVVLVAPDARDENEKQEAHQRQTTDQGKLYTNNILITEGNETLSSFIVDTQGFESVYKMRRRTFSYICSLFEDMMVRGHTFVDGRVLSLHDGVAIALRVLNSGETPEIVGSSFGVDESTVSLLVQRFVNAMVERERAMCHISWPGSAQMEKIKRKFDKVHSLPNCCGIVHTTHTKFGSQDHDHEENDGMQMQTVVDPDMRFTNLLLRSSDNMNQASILHGSNLFKYCENGAWLNGSKLKVSSGGDGDSGSEVREYVIGDTGYPLRPWLLTPYQLENGLSLSDSQVYFNRRHSAAMAVALRALTRLKDTWKCLEAKGWSPNNEREMLWTVYTCCMLHNIVIYMEEEEEEEGAGMPREQEEDGIKQVRQVAEEDAVKVRDALSKHLIQSGVNTMASEQEQGAVATASASKGEYREEEARLRQQKADRGKEKLHDN